VDLERDARRPGAAELGRWDAGVTQHSAFRTRTRLGQHLGGKHPEREAGIDEVVRQALGGAPAARDDGVEADLLGIGEVGESLAVVPS
jgi:hypothetical protein